MGLGKRHGSKIWLLEYQRRRRWTFSSKDWITFWVMQHRRNTWPNLNMHLSRLGFLRRLGLSQDVSCFQHCVVFNDPMLYPIWSAQHSTHSRRTIISLGCQPIKEGQRLLGTRLTIFRKQNNCQTMLPPTVSWIRIQTQTGNLDQQNPEETARYAKERIWKMVVKESYAPKIVNFRGFLKVHKKGVPLRQIVALPAALI